MTAEPDLRRRAILALSEGRVDAGIQAYRALLAKIRGGPDDWYNLGYLLRCARDFDAALHAYDRAIAAGIDRPEEVRLNRAVILSEHCDRPEAAEAELRLALASAPALLPAWLNLGNLYEDRGAAAEAQAAYRQALAIDAGNGRARARLAMIDIHQGRAAVAVDQLRDLLARPGLSPVAAAEMGFALGAALDALEDYDAAFAAFTVANRTAAQASDPRLRYDRAAQERLTDDLIAATPGRAQARPEAEVAPIFICGMFRSGSTLTEQMLGRHPMTHAAGELEVIPALAHAIPGYPRTLPSLDEERLTALRDRYRAEVRPPAGTLRITDKRPDSILHVGLIKQMFPDARIVHTVRQPLDNILSVWFLYFDDHIRYGHDLGDAAHYYRQCRRLMDHWQRSYPGDIHQIPYEALVADPEPAMRALTDFAGLPWDPAVLAPERGDAIVRTASVWQVRQPLHQRSVDRWRHYAGPLAAFRDQLGDLLDGMV